MPFREMSGLKYFFFSALDELGIQHGIFTRRGGVSPSPWASLNTGGMSGDSRVNIVENRRRIFSVLSLSVESIFDVWQVHSTRVVIADRPRALDTPHQKADAIITDKVGVTLFMRFGDCVPILLVDPIKRVIGMAHAGWQGTVGLIARSTVDEMVRNFGCRPGDVIAAIGPSIGPDHYQVRDDVIKRVGEFFCEDDQVIKTRDDRQYFDLWEANRQILEKSGVLKIEQAGICTACHMDDWYSHRGEHGKTGRYGALISLT